MTTQANTTPRWKRYNIFISSTFRDMDFERDIIKHNVIPQLNARYRSAHVELQAIDLRMGVNTEKMSEDEAANKVLQVCAQCIDESRPFFVGLIGARYGWVPPLEYWQRFIDNLPPAGRQTMMQTQGKSVTEMEIIYGALSQRSLDTSHVLFFLRDDSSYEGMSSERRPEFIDDDPEQQRKLKLLRQTIRDRIAQKGGDDDRATDYHLRWDHETADFEEEDNEFERLITEQLAHQIDLELAIEDEQPWWQREKQTAEACLAHHLTDISTALPHYGELPDTPGTIFSGDVGSGRSTLLAWHWRQAADRDENICLVGIVGHTAYSRDMKHLLSRWCIELADILGEEPGDANEFMADDTPLVRVCDEFYWLVEQAQEKERQVWLFIDDADRFLATSPQDAYLAWIDYRVKALVTVSIDFCIELNAAHQPWEDLSVEPLDAKATEAVIRVHERRLKTELPKSIHGKLTAQPRPAVYAAAIVRFLPAAMNSASFVEIRQQKGSQIDAINQYIDEFYDIAFEDDEESVTMMPSQLASIVLLALRLDEQWWMNMLGYLSHSPAGLRLNDLEALGGEGWDAVEWAQITHFLQEYLEEDADHVWHARFQFFGYDDNTPFKDLANYSEDLPEDDWLRSQMLAYYTIREADKDFYEATAFTMSAPAAYQLMIDQWLELIDLPAFMQQLDADDRKELARLLYDELFANEGQWQLDEEALDEAKDDIIDPLELTEEGIAEVDENLPVLYKTFIDDSSRQKMRQLLLKANPQVKPQPAANPYAEWTREAHRLRNKRSLFSKTNQLDEVRYRVQQLATIQLPPKGRINDEMLLENMTLQLIGLCGAVWRLRQQPKQAAKVGDDVLTQLDTDTHDAYMTTFHRLMQVNPESPVVLRLAPIIDLLDNKYQFITHSDVIRSIVDICRELRL